VTHFIAGDLVMFDTETDAKDPDAAHLIEAAVVATRPGQQPHEQVWLAQPRRPISVEATGVHGISTERAATEGQPIRAVLREVMWAGLLGWTDRCPLIGHNIGYDLTVLDRELRRYLLDEFPNGLEIRGPVIDTLLIDKCCDKWRAGSRQLEDAAKHYRVALDKAHSAGADALAAGRIAWRMATTRAWPRGRWGPAPIEREARKLIAVGNARELHEAQKRWFYTTQMELAEYFRTPKAIEAIERKVSEGRFTREQADAAIESLPADAARAEALAVDGWPLRPLVAALA
jgi:DNA polymerase-3 subunit epsilon